MTLYSAGVRRSELVKLKVSDVDSQRMVIHVYQGKGNRDREVQLSNKLLVELRDYWRWMRPRTYLFPGYRIIAAPTFGQGDVARLPASR